MQYIKNAADLYFCGYYDNLAPRDITDICWSGRNASIYDNSNPTDARLMSAVMQKLDAFQIKYIVHNIKIG